MAKIKRDDPFGPEDTREIALACRRVAAASEYLSAAGWREDAGYRLFHFATWAKARAMQHWIDRSGIAHRPAPKLGPTPEEKATLRRDALAWGLDTGAVHDVVEAYRRARRCGNSQLTAINDAAAMAHALGRSNEQCQETARVLIAWAMETQAAWFEGIEG